MLRIIASFMALFVVLRWLGWIDLPLWMVLFVPQAVTVCYIAGVALVFIMRDMMK